MKKEEEFKGITLEDEIKLLTAIIKNQDEQIKNLTENNLIYQN
jgi:hypothetical protein